MSRNVSSSARRLVAVLIAFVCIAGRFASGQNISISTPTTRINDSQSNGGFRLNGGMGGIGFGLSGGQGSNRSTISQSPSVTVSNGGTGTFIDTIQRPFVIGYTPVVGGFHATYPGMYASPAAPTLIYPIQQALQRMAAGDIPPPSSAIDQLGSTRSTVSNNSIVASHSGATPHSESNAAVASSASRPDISVAAIQRQKAALIAADNANVAEFVNKSELAESTGDYRAAVRWIDQARRNSKGTERKKFEARIRNLRSAARQAASASKSE